MHSPRHKLFHARPSLASRRSTALVIMTSLAIGIVGFTFGIAVILLPGLRSTGRNCLMNVPPKTVRVVWDVAGNSNGFGGDRKKHKVMGFVGIQTGFASAGRRQSLRKTWMPSDPEGLRRLEESTGLAFRFMIGKTKNKEKMAELRREVAEYDDFILLDIEEEYSKLPYKTLAFFKAAYALYDSEFYVKADDDIYLRPDRLSLLLAKERSHSQTYLGCLKKGPVFTDPKLKWYEPLSNLLGKEYFLHAYGPIYALSADVVASLVALKNNSFRMFSNEDVTIGAWMLAMNVNHENHHVLCEPECSPSSVAVWDIPKCSDSSLSFSKARMDHFPGGVNENSMASQFDILRCPFLRNINEPTNLSFSSSLPFPMPAREGKGPIFEDGPNFDTAFRLFHGQDGVVPLSNTARAEAEKPVPVFHPLAAKAATISLSSFGAGGPFGFDAFSDMFKNQKKKSDSSNHKGGNHEAMGDEWLKTGNCPIAKSYRAVSGVAPLVAKILKPPPGMQYKCPEVIVKARAAISKTPFAKNLRPQPLPAKVLVIGMLGMALNVPLGVWREHTEKYSASWFIALHAAVPFIGILRKSVLMPKTAMVFTIAASVLGQVIGSRAERRRLKLVTEKEMTMNEAIPVTVEADQMQKISGITSDGRCGEKVMMKWNPMLLDVASPVSSGAASVVC